MAPESTQPASLVLGPNVQVSKANESFHHFEPQIIADPTKPARLFVAAILEPPSGKGYEDVVGYFSDDGGKNWVATLGGAPNLKYRTGDPALAAGLDGALHLVRPRSDVKATAGQGKTIDFGDKSGAGYLDFFLSADGGKSWKPSGSIKQYTDRPWLAVDTTTGKYRGRLYCSANIRDIVLHTSADGAKTFAPPTLFKPEGPTFRNSNPVILSDGTLVTVYDYRAANPEVRPQIKTLISNDGGRTVRKGKPVPTDWSDKRIKTTNWNFFPQLAIDSTGGPHRDRLYAVWEDGWNPAITRLMFAYSKDGCKSWVGPVILSEHAPDLKKEQDYGVYIPAIAVNKRGVVAVTWYDRRSLPLVAGKRYPLGCNVRMRISSYGGETWQSSVQINEQQIKAPIEDLRDTAGLTAAADGNFHVAWIDDRTGTRQVWTAQVKVEVK
jgi:hypothetical protein